MASHLVRRRLYSNIQHFGFVSKSAKRNFFSPPDLFKLAIGSEGDGNPSNVLSHSQKKILPYTPKQVYDVVSDVDKYFLFVPWCTKSQVHTVKKEASLTHLTASLSIGFSAFSENYTSQVKCQPYTLVEARNHNSSLFKELYSRWELSPHASTGGCVVEFLVRFELNSSLYATLSKMYFEKVTSAMVEAFEQRCKKVYL